MSKNKLFYKNLNDKEKFRRDIFLIFIEILFLLLLYIVDMLKIEYFIIMVITLVISIGIAISHYKKYKNS